MISIKEIWKYDDLKFYQRIGRTIHAIPHNFVYWITYKS